MAHPLHLDTLSGKSVGINYDHVLKGFFPDAENVRQKKNPNEPPAVLNMMDKAMTKIPSIDTSAWADDDKTNFQTSLTSLKTEIDTYLAAPPPAAPSSKKTSKKPA